MTFVLMFICVSLIGHISCNANSRVDPLVKINQGLVRGQKTTDGQNFYSYFLGIPYATVDLNNPFGSALPPRNFKDEIFDAYEGSIRCPQSDIFPYVYDLETVDCLRLNIYVPYEASSKNPVPVLVWIHGGGFSEGYAGEYNPRKLVKHGIIVVTINYRLGAYGFLCLDSHLVTGNQGLKDQHEALRWIRNNISAFGGNPDKITLAGQNAGAVSALLHLYTEKEKYYNQLIAQSGTPLSMGSFIEGDYDAAIKLATHLGLNTSDTIEALNFLSKTYPSLIIKAQKELNLHFSPCREKSFSGVDHFITDYLFELSNKAKTKDTAIMIGQSSMELASEILINGEDYFNTNPIYDILIDTFNIDEKASNTLADIIKIFYFGDEPISVNVTTELETFNSDFVFNHPLRRTITNLLNEHAAPVFEYLFSHKDNENDYGANYLSENKYLFDVNGIFINTSEDQLISDRITALWTNFVKYGHPTPVKTDLLPVTWEPSCEDSRPYLVIDTDMKLKHRLFKERMAFWDLFYLVYGDKHKMSRISC